MLTSSRLSGLSALLCALVCLLFFGAGNALAKGGHHHRSRFKGSGTWNVSAPTACGSDMCYTASGNLMINSVDVTLTANGMFDPSTCKTRGKKTCCPNAMTGQFQTPDGNVDFSFAGRGCKLSDTLETLKGPMRLDGVSGQLDGENGAGVLQAQVNPQTGEGPIKVSGALHK